MVSGKGWEMGQFQPKMGEIAAPDLNRGHFIIVRDTAVQYVVQV